MTARRAWLCGLAAAIVVVAAGLIELGMGRVPICRCGYVKLWHGLVYSSENSQHIADWYSLTHVIHGVGFYMLLWLVARRLPPGVRFVLVVVLEAAWEVFENYGMLSGSVAERTREIGVRSALGASRVNILALVLRQTMTLTGLGVAILLAGAAVASRAIAALLFGVSRLDPVTYLAMFGLIAAVSAIACGIPVWRAVRVDPASTLRAE